MVTRVVVCGTMAATRLLELVWSRRNLAVSGGAREGRWSRLTFPGIIAVHATAIHGTLLRGSGRPRAAWLALLLAVQPVRFWTMATLGRRWNARGAVPRGLEVATTGPYAFIRHPNYAVICAELAALPAAFGLPRLALAVTVANAALLAIRIREEEALLFSLPGYREHFTDKPRFIPFLV